MPNAFPELYVTLPLSAFEEEGVCSKTGLTMGRMLDLITLARAGQEKFTGVDVCLGERPLSDRDAREFADSILARQLTVGTVVAPPAHTIQRQEEFLQFVLRACGFAEILKRAGVRGRGIIGINSLNAGPATFQEATRIASGYCERLVAHDGSCTNSLEDTVKIFEEVDMPGTFGFRVNIATVQRYVKKSPGEEFHAAWERMISQLRPWTIDLHIAHCEKPEVVAGDWLQNAADRDIHHISSDRLLLPNCNVRLQPTWNKILLKMLEIREQHGWN